LNYVERLVATLNQEEVDAHHVAFGKLLKWVNNAIASRKQDITRRKALTKKAREEREQRIAASEERATNRAATLTDQEEKFKEEHREDIEAYEKY